MKYRERVKGNIRNVVVVGKNKKTQQLINVFNERTEYGYHFMKQFCPKEKGFDIRDSFSFIVQNNIDEIYCSVSELNNSEISEIYKLR